MASWARRSLAAETIFIALVICWVLFTDRMRFRMSQGWPWEVGGPYSPMAAESTTVHPRRPCAA
jgi:hypothetical protein